MIAIGSGLLGCAAGQAQVLKETIDSLDRAGSGPAAQLETQLALESLLDLEEFELAEGMANELIETTAADFGDTSIELADAYLILAEVERLSGEYLDAEKSYLAALEIHRGQQDPDAESLVEIMSSLAQNYHTAGFYNDAVATFEEAHGVQRQNFGLLDMDQIELLDRMTASLMGMRLFEEARKAQVEAMTLYERVYPPGSPEMLDGVYHFAYWLGVLGRQPEARLEIERAIRTTRDNLGDTSPQLVRAYRELAMFGANSLQRLAAMDRALKVASSQEPPDPVLEASVLMDIGDMYRQFGTQSPEQYFLAWEALEPYQDADEVRVAWFAPKATFVRWDSIERYPPPENSMTAVSGDISVRLIGDPSGRDPMRVEVFRSDPVPERLLDARTTGPYTRAEFGTAPLGQ